LVGGIKIAETAEIATETFKVSVFGDVKAINKDGSNSAEGFPLSIVGKGDGVTLTEVKMSATILPEPGNLKLAGRITFGEKATATVAVQFSEEDSSQDDFYVQIKNATFADVMHLAQDLIGIYIPLPIDGLMKKIIINEMILYYAPTGIDIFDTHIEEGFGFKADLLFFGVALKAAMTVGDDSFHLEAQMDPISILNGNLAVTGSGGNSGPHVKMDLTPTKKEFLLNCEINFLFISTDCDMHLRFPSEMEIKLFWKVLGIEAQFNLASHTDEESMDVFFSLHAGQKKQVNDAVVRKIMKAAQQMQKDADIAEEEADTAVATYQKALDNLNTTLDKANDDFKDYVSKINTIAQTEETALSDLQVQTEILTTILQKSVIEQGKKIHECIQ